MMALPYPPMKSQNVTTPSAGAITEWPYELPISTPLWNAPSPLNGSIRSPKLPVMGPSTGQRLGAEFARSQSAVVASRVSPREMPVMVAPFRAEALRAPNWSREETTCAVRTFSDDAVTMLGSDFRPQSDETSPD